MRLGTVQKQLPSLSGWKEHVKADLCIVMHYKEKSIYLLYIYVAISIIMKIWVDFAFSSDTFYHSILTRSKRRTVMYFCL